MKSRGLSESTAFMRWLSALKTEKERKLVSFLSFGLSDWIRFSAEKRIQ